MATFRLRATVNQVGRHRSGLCQVCAVQLDLQRSPSRICRKRRAPNFFAL
jgi:hypothetical protein